MSVREGTDGYVHAPQEGRPVWLLDGLVVWKATRGTTGGHFELVEQQGRRGFGPPVHLHEQEAEGFYILEGELTFLLNDRTIRAEPGSFVFVPPATKHAFVVDSAEAKFLLVVTPPGKFEAFVNELSEPATSAILPPPSTTPPDRARFDAAAQRHGQRSFGPPLRPSVRS